ncbi:hypothetical protein DTL42_24520 [Bremerella cremea]|uniref:Signal peptide-containing protein n=1 Tax=Bremerella cremea TaxID=1031537 RepID=A0A368KJ16_9BACT|nr:hypothetical protein [Bremerella cremea]RCS40542.1 hypothetical protein DTL42_24520 [Bremerella cremea]
MIRKIACTGIGAAVLAGLVFGTDAYSYISTTASRLGDNVKNSVPVEFELDRARKMITDLTPEIRRNMHLIAKEEVEVEKLQSRVGDLEKKLASSKTDIVRLKSDLDSGSTYFTYAGHEYSRSAVQTDLAGRFERFKTQDATRVKLESILRARQQGLEAARAKLDGMLTARRQLEVDVENLEARQKMVEVAQTSSKFAFDDSQLSKTKRLIDDIRTRIDVAERMVDVDGELAGEIPLDEPTHTDIGDEVASYFGLEVDEEEEQQFVEIDTQAAEKLSSRNTLTLLD